MNRYDSDALDKYITGNYGEDQFEDAEEEAMTMTREEIVEELRCIFDPIIQGHQADIQRIIDADYKLRPSDEEEGDLGGEWRLALSSPCACGGEEPFARGGGWLPPLDEPPPNRWLQRLTAQPSKRQRRGWRYVRVLVFDALPAGEGKPCS